MSKRRVYLNEYNVLMENTVYFPLVCGQLQAYAQTKPAIRENYEFMPYLFIRDAPEKIIAQYDNPAVAAFSVSMWNLNLSLAVAKGVKAKFPDCLVVFGGPSVPLNSVEFIGTYPVYPSIDVIVHGEGECVFADLLERLLKTKDFKGIAGISHLDQSSPHRGFHKHINRSLEENLDTFPSPYLEGLFDDILKRDMDFQVIVETSRGCPFGCSFCSWGQGQRVRNFSLERIKDIATWCGIKGVRYVFCADSNFGMFRRDFDIASYFTEAKTKYGFPEKFRAAYGKNAESNIHAIGALLHEHDMDKGVTLSRQSNDPQTLTNVGRKNINMAVYDNLQKRYDAAGIPTYTELILGLPGETYESFVRGMEEILRAGKTQIFVYPCQVYPNTELAIEEYQDKFGIETVRVPLREIHGLVREDELPLEYEELVISTATMPLHDWKKALVVSWIMQLFHGLQLGHSIMDYLATTYHDFKYVEFFRYIASLKPETVLGIEVGKFRNLADSVTDGYSCEVAMPDFGAIYWSPEEAAYLNIAWNKKDEFYEEMARIGSRYLRRNNDELKGIIEYQRSCIPTYTNKKDLGRTLLHGRKTGQL